MRLLTMAPKSRVKRKAEAASQASANTRKNQRVSLDSVDSLPTHSEIAPSSIGSRSPAVEGETAVIAGECVAGPSSGLEGESIAGPGEGSSVSGPSVRDVGVSIAGPSSLSAEEAGVSSEGVPGATGIEGQSASPKEILGKFAEDWLEALDKDEIRSISLFLCFHLVDKFSFTETKAAEYAAAMVQKNERTV